MSETTREPITRVTMFVPGAPASEVAWNQALGNSGLTLAGGVLEGTGLEHAPEVMWVPQDGGFGQAFSFGTCSDDVIARLEKAPGALVILWPIDLREGRAHILTAVELLRDAGAIAVRLEQSKLGWDVQKWLDIFSADDASAWHRGAITLLGNDGYVQSCGMHLFSLPDVQVPFDAGADAANTIAQTMNMYQIAEDPALRSGHTFAPDTETPRRVIERWPDTGYPSDHPCHKPYGVWRLGPEGGKAREVGKLELVFMPSVHAILSASEERKGSALTEKEVLAIRDASNCITMEPTDARKMEHARGYADLNPELLWAQWQLVREN
ncbi:hypothetical protein BH11MYX2_BH11MYX2_40110 [soil metagenome]